MTVEALGLPQLRLSGSRLVALLKCFDELVSGGCAESRRSAEEVAGANHGGGGYEVGEPRRVL